jgi:hypothetical protein
MAAFRWTSWCHEVSVDYGIQKENVYRIAGEEKGMAEQEFEAPQGLRWIRADLHIHTPASEDYVDKQVSYLDILREAARRDLEIIAFTDHNTVHGYEQLFREVEFLGALEKANRLNEDEREQLAEYRQLLGKITVLPGFEFTSHYGAHILGIFPPDKPISLIEATLLQLGVPPEQLKAGSCSITDTRHVTEAYEIINRAGGLVIAAHANGPSGVISETLRMGTSGQARIAATQSAWLHALEFVNFYTDHDTFTSPGFYNGRTEHYERRMFCLQGSDAHRLRRAEENGPNGHKHGIGDRYVELLLGANSFAALKSLLTSQHFDRVRIPKRDQKQWDVDRLRLGQASERHALRSAHDEEQLWRDVAALANAGGGVLIAGVIPGSQEVEGVARPDQVSEGLRRSVAEQIDPQPYLSFELMHYEGRDLVRVEVKTVGPPPYVSADGVVYVRREGETAVANRSELLQLCRRALAEGAVSPLDNGQELDLPRSGVQVVGEQKRSGLWLYEVRDLRTTAGVTRDRAQGLWAYAISRHEELRDGRLDLHGQIKWHGRLGLWRAYRQGNRTKYDLVHRDANGVVDHIFYGVSDWGLSEGWRELLGMHEEAAPPEREEEEPDAPFSPEPLLDEPEAPPLASAEERWGQRRTRWRGRGGLEKIYLDSSRQPRFDLVMKDRSGGENQFFEGVLREKLTDAWMNLVRVPRPRTGIEVVSCFEGEDGERRFLFRNLRTGETSAMPWRMQDIEEGTVREYAARMYLSDFPVDDSKVRWWGNIGYMRPMRSQVDLVYRDEHGVDHMFYAARRDELADDWRDLLIEYGEL